MSVGGRGRGYRQKLGSRLKSGLAQSASRSYPNNDLAGRSISGGSTRRVALTERTRSASAFLSLPLMCNSGKSSQRTQEEVSSWPRLVVYVSVNRSLVTAMKLLTSIC